MNKPRWLTHFESYNGVREIAGPQNNATIMELIDRADGKDDGKPLQGITNDEIPWCASALCGSLEEIGIRSPRSAWARSFLNWGMRLPGPSLGAIVIFERGPTSGHVGMVAGRFGDYLSVFGGNQRDMFCYALFPRNRVLGYRWIEGEQFPVNVSFVGLPLVTSNGIPVSTKEN